jgi:hypothetical protein
MLVSAAPLAGPSLTGTSAEKKIRETFFESMPSLKRLKKKPLLI